MPLSEAGKKAQKKYDEKRKKIACSVPIEKYEIIKKHATSKGFTSLNSYILSLIDKDMNKWYINMMFCI